MREQVLIRYIGKKLVKTDNVCGSKTVWHGNGDEQSVDVKDAPRLLRHADVFEVASAVKVPDTSTSAKANVERLDALRAQAKALGIDVKGTWREPKLLSEIAAVEAAKSGDGNGDEQSGN